eukprot:gnl/MRDRNA2_/MRDRNA2_72216_c0_seq2.p1 gnl/MRDRNA2_/MRDRNA2_72216_c0~~gnl/MRDRNA2_/MRDRNA2_72216_c0_seq2.p1  ORF type:complete len:152 (+),score=18.90 gnl/MRDRNA2_/MRDRNA2_72216_c0_seq2:128-583(+)
MNLCLVLCSDMHEVLGVVLQTRLKELVEWCRKNLSSIKFQEVEGGDPLLQDSEKMSFIACDWVLQHRLMSAKASPLDKVRVRAAIQKLWKHLDEAPGHKVVIHCQWESHVRNTGEETLHRLYGIRCGFSIIAVASIRGSWIELQGSMEKPF